MVERRSLRANLRDLALAHLAVKPLWFLFLVLSTRWLGATEFGRVMLAVSFVTVLAALLEGGLDIFLVRQLSTRPESYRRLFGYSLLWKSASGIAVGLLAWTLSHVPVLGPPARELLPAAVAYSLCSTLMIHCRSVFRAFEVMNREAVSLTVEKGIVMLLAGAAVRWRPEASAFLWAMALAYLLALLVTLVQVRRLRGWPERPREAGTLWRDVLLPAFPFAFLNVFTVIYFRSGTLLLSALTGRDELVGYYNAGYRLVEAYMLFPSLITVPLYPVLARRTAEGRPVADLLRPAIGAVAGITLLGAVPLALWRGTFTRLLFGAAFDPARDAVGLLVLTMLPVGLTFVFGTLVAASGRQGRANRFIVGATAANLALNAWLIPVWGVSGAALTTLVTETLITAGNLWVVRDLLRREPVPA
jgi:O-antigen/teichoic acid export membrane protein